MRLRNGDLFDLIVDPGEEITIEVSSTEALLLVSYRLNGNGLPFRTPLTFVPDADPSLLSALFTFSVPNNEEYEVVVTGSHGGDVSKARIRQLFAIPFDQRFYTFDIVGS
jgi:hypothetical protein